MPDGEGWAYEPKYDGFRALVFVDGDEVYVQSRGGRPLLRYFPELEFPAGRYVIDGELVILDEDGREVFDALQDRIHPAESRVNMLAEQTPALFRAFDLLAIGDEEALDEPFAERRAALRAVWSRASARRARGSVELTPLTTTRPRPSPGSTGEGVIAKELDAPYRPGERKGMAKVKRLRTIDAVIVGWRPGKEENTVGSLILGLYDGGELRVVGHTSGPEGQGEARARRELAPYETGDRGSADPSRWAADRELEWVSPAPRARHRGRPSTTSPPAASATARRSSAGATTRRPRSELQPSTRSCTPSDGRSGSSSGKERRDGPSGVPRAQPSDLGVMAPGWEERREWIFGITGRSASGS